MLAKAYPTGVSTADPQTGCLPLHQVMTGSTLAVVRILLEQYPDATKAVDLQGRLPLHTAVLNMAPYSVVEALIEEDPTSVTVVDAQGKTAFNYAMQTYGCEDMVTELLTMVMLFEKELPAEQRQADQVATT
jgi:ankyrin repeat protein